MKRTLFTAAAAAVLATGFGCNQSPPGGKPTGSPNPGTGSTPATTAHSTESGLPSITGDKGTFTIKAPVLSKSIKQGDKETLDLTIDRGSEFKQGIKLTADAPKGVKAELSKSQVAAGDPDKVSLSVSVDKDAALGDQTIKVTGTPDTGNATSVDVKVKVTEGPKK